MYMYIAMIVFAGVAIGTALIYFVGGSKRDSAR